MFFRNYSGWRLEGTNTVEIRCTNCGNTSSHFIYVVPVGFQFGVIFASKPLVGNRKYFLTCPICGNLAKEISREQAEAMRS